MLRIFFTFEGKHTYGRILKWDVNKYQRQIITFKPQTKETFPFAAQYRGFQ